MIQIDANLNKRADEFAEREYITNEYEKERIAFGYYHGAIEQRKIDIDKAWRLYNRIVCDSWTKESFTKAMEG